MLGKFFSSRFQQTGKVVLYCLCTVALVIAGFPVAAGAQQAYPDIAATSLSGPGSAAPLQAISVTYTIRNLGQVDTGGFNLGFYLSPAPDTMITTADIPIGAVSVCGLPAGAQLTVPVTLTIPSNVPMGTYYLGMIADPENHVTESDETNNSIAGNLIQIVYNLPDLAPTQVSTPATTVYTGGPISGSGSVVNYGAPVQCTQYCYTDDDTGERVCQNRDSFETALVLSADNALTDYGSGWGYFGFNSLTIRGVCGLGTGQSITMNYDGTVSPRAMPGDYYVGLLVSDPSSLAAAYVSETDTSNNTLVGNNGNKVAVIGPDLVMVDVSGPESALLGDTINISTTVKTLAGGTNGFDVQIYICQNPDLGCPNYSTLGNCVALATHGVPSLAPLATSSTVAVSVRLPALDEYPNYFQKPGVYYIYAAADPYGYWVPNEIDKSNNCMRGSQITLTAP